VSAEVLREAAALMRTRAKAANTIAWYVPETLIRGKSLDPVDEVVDAEFIASWSPSVALAVARWLEDESHAPETDLGDGITCGGPRMEALDVARAYLGTTP
jgi:hypothetical protein